MIIPIIRDCSIIIVATLLSISIIYIWFQKD